MVALPRVVDVEKEAGQGGESVLIDDGRYPAIILSSEEKMTKSGGSMVVFTYVITSGKYQNTEFTDRVNIKNSNPKAVEIGLQRIANVGKSVGLSHVNDTVELHNKPLIIDVKAKKQNDWVNDEGETVEGAMKSEIKKILPASASTSTNQMMQADPQPQQQQQESVAAPQSNPFA